MPKEDLAHLPEPRPEGRAAKKRSPASSAGLPVALAAAVFAAALVFTRKHAPAPAAPPTAAVQAAPAAPATRAAPEVAQAAPAELLASASLDAGRSVEAAAAAKAAPATPHLARRDMPQPDAPAQKADLAPVFMGRASIKDKIAEPLYINIGPRESDEHPQADEVVLGAVFNTPLDNYPVLGDTIDVIADGKHMTLAFKPSGVYPGGKYVAVHLPGMLQHHELVMLARYDLGPDGMTAVRIVSRTDGLAGASGSFQSVLETRPTGQAGRLRVR